MSTIHTHYSYIYRSLRITDYAQDKLDTSYQHACRYHIESTLDGLAQAYVPNGTTHIVNLRQRSCTCGEFQEHQLPCRHAIAVCLAQAHDPYDYVHTYYSVDFYSKTYEKHMQPIREEDLVDEFSDCEAPILTKQRGQPKKRRYRHDEAPNRCQVVCGHCGEQGHNRRSCRNALGT
jgi:predicted nucleic acid-binding Zn finger protein